MNQIGNERKAEYDLENFINNVGVLLDHIDYTAGACRMNEMIAAVLPPSVLSNVKYGVSILKTSCNWYLHPSEDSIHRSCLFVSSCESSVFRVNDKSFVHCPDCGNKILYLERTLDDE